LVVFEDPFEHSIEIVGRALAGAATTAAFRAAAVRRRPNWISRGRIWLNRAENGENGLTIGAADAGARFLD
jgi:hypothetical protein